MTHMECAGPPALFPSPGAHVNHTNPSPLSALTFATLRSAYIAACRETAASYYLAAAAAIDDPALARFYTLRAADNQETADRLEATATHNSVPSVTSCSNEKNQSH